MRALALILVVVASTVYALPRLATGQPSGEVLGVFRGTYSCGQGQTALTLRVVRTAPGERTRAVFQFGPTAAFPGVPFGSFWLEGRIDLGGGVVTLAPAAWIEQPPQFETVGLNGVVDPGGMAMRGTIIGGRGCSNFEVQRVG